MVEAERKLGKMREGRRRRERKRGREREQEKKSRERVKTKQTRKSTNTALRSAARFEFTLKKFIIAFI